MVQVPYSPTPDARPTDASGQQVNVQVDPNMFGMAVGEATKGLGNATENFGNVVARHALQLQDRQNQLDANNLSIDGMIKLGAETNKLNSLEGDAAVKYLPEYQKNVEQIFSDISGQAPNQAVGLLVQQEMRRQVGYNIINGSRYAAGQQKAAYKASLDSKYALALDQAVATQTEGAITYAQDQAVEKLKATGTDDPASIEAARLNATDTVIGQLVPARALQDPFAAKNMLENYKGRISAGQYNALSKTVLNAVNTIGAKQLADQAASGGVPKGSALDVIAGGESGGDYNRLLNAADGSKRTADLTNMTVKEVLDYQAKNKDPNQPSLSAGKYQIVRLTLAGLVKDGTISLDDKFDQNTQDRAAVALFNKRVTEGGGDLDKTMTALGNEWDIIKKDPQLAAQVAGLVKAGGMGKAFLQPLSASSTPQDLDRSIAQVQQTAANRMPGNQTLIDNAVDAVKHRYDQAKALDNLQNQAASRAVTQDLIGGPQMDQPKPTELKPFIAAHQQYWDKLTPTQQDAVAQRIKQNSKGEDYPAGIPERKRFAELHGMAISGDDDQVKKFLATDLWSEKLPGNMISQLVALQQKTNGLVQKAYEFPVTNAEKMLERDGTFKNLGMPDKNSPDRNMFRSQLQVELSDWQNDHAGKKPSYDEVKAMAFRLLSPVGNTLSQNWWPFGSHPAYQDREPIPAEELSVLMPALRRQLGRAPNRTEIYDWYNQNRDKIKRQVAPQAPLVEAEGEE